MQQLQWDELVKDACVESNVVQSDEELTETGELALPELLEGLVHPGAQVDIVIENGETERTQAVPATDEQSMQAVLERFAVVRLVDVAGVAGLQNDQTRYGLPAYDVAEANVDDGAKAGETLYKVNHKLLVCSGGSSELIRGSRTRV